jgi:hypothetical protein
VRVVPAASGRGFHRRMIGRLVRSLACAAGSRSCQWLEIQS